MQLHERLKELCENDSEEMIHIGCQSGSGWLYIGRVADAHERLAIDSYNFVKDLNRKLRNAKKLLDDKMKHLENLKAKNDKSLEYNIFTASVSVDNVENRIFNIKKYKKDFRYYNNREIIREYLVDDEENEYFHSIIISGIENGVWTLEEYEELQNK